MTKPAILAVLVDELDCRTAKRGDSQNCYFAIPIPRRDVRDRINTMKETPETGQPSLAGVIEATIEQYETLSAQ